MKKILSLSSVNKKDTVNVLAEDGLKITGGKTRFPIYEIKSKNLSFVVDLITFIYRDIQERFPSNIKYISVIRDSDSPIGKEKTDNGIGVCIVIFRRKSTNTFYIATDNRKHDNAVDYRLFSKESDDLLIFAGKILGHSPSGKVHINDQSGSFHRMIKYEGLDTEFIKLINNSNESVVHLYLDYVGIVPIKL